ncbi:hypothetical protein [Mycobacterium sp.]|uniref:hypothetical protein n=1 Tax=Mycobacterium sp. TaxID=1785 RepID=UPI00127F3D39|nr:hypothetical protein [Mycobacterium sp.]KAA8969136.1 MAG: hypothetical protein F6Q13_04060 [Mycobacterium sp.]
MSAWFNYSAIVKILLFSLLVGAGLPALFAAGVRLQATGAGVADGHVAAATKRPALVALSWIIYGLVLTAVLLGVLFIARDFIAAKTGWYLLGATQVHAVPEMTE